MSHAGLLDTRSRRRYVVANGDDYPLLGGKPSKPISAAQIAYTVITLLVIGAAFAGLITGSIALSYGKNDINDPLTLGELTVAKIKVTNMTDLSMSEVIPGTWMAPPLPPSSKRSKRMTVDYDVDPTNRQIVLGNTGVTYNLHFPKNLNAYVSKEYHIFSNTSQPHTILFTGPGCGGTYEDTTWDAARQKPLAKFDAEPGAYIHFKVVDCGTVTLIESRKVDFCFEDMTHCEHPKRNVNADWADVKDLKVTGSLEKVDPTQVGKYDVGFMDIQVQLSNQIHNVAIWYPTDPLSFRRALSTRTDLGSENVYHIDGVEAVFGLPLNFNVSSKYNAVKNAPISNTGPFEVVIHCHAALTFDTFDRFFAADQMEYLATHGFIAVSYNRKPNDAGPLEITQILNYLENNFVYASHVNTNSVGLMGSSTGSSVIAGLFGNGAPDSRIKAVFLGEYFFNENFAMINVPSLMYNAEPPARDGFDVLQVETQAAYNSMVNAHPRYLYTLKQTGHIGMGDAKTCEILQRLRLASFAADETRDPATMPPTTNGFGNVFGLPPNGGFFYFLTAVSDLFGIPAFVGLGNGNENCLKIGTDAYPLDLNNDERDDPPAYITGTAVSSTNETIVLDATFTVENIEFFPLKTNASYLTDNALAGYFIVVDNGSGDIQVRTIDTYNGTTREVTLDSELPYTSVSTYTISAVPLTGSLDRNPLALDRKTNNVLYEEDVSRILDYSSIAFFKTHVKNDKSFEKYASVPFFESFPEIVNVQFSE